METCRGRDVRQLWALALLLTFVNLMINSVGFVGGGQDDGRYLEAAQCWVQHGWCLPGNHWAARWPVFAPTAALIGVFGEYRTTVQIWPIISSVVAICLFTSIVNRWFGTRVAVVAALLFAFTPAFSIQTATPSVESVELCALMLAIMFITKWTEHKNLLLAFAAGVFFGVAFQIRETSLIAAFLILVFSYAVGLRPRFSDLAAGIIGFCIPLAAELIFYAYATGDPFYRRNLSLNHARLPSSELAPTVDTSGSPLFNREIIGGWRREPGLQIHWMVDGPLNLLLNAKAGVSLLLTPVLLLFYRKTIVAPKLRSAWLLLAFAAAYVSCINYILAMDPKPRVMLEAIAASSVAFAVVIIALWTAGRRLLAGTCLLSSLLAGVYVLGGYLRPVWAEQQLLQWSQQFPEGIEIDRMTRMMLTLEPKLRSMPTLAESKRYFATISTTSCSKWIQRAALPDGAMIAVGERALSLFPMPGDSGAWLCLFKYKEPVSGPEMQLAVRRTWMAPTQ